MSRAWARQGGIRRKSGVCLALQKPLDCHVATLLAMTVLFLDILVEKERFALERRKAVENAARGSRKSGAFF